MFTGIIQQTATVASSHPAPTGRHLVLAAELPNPRLGESIAINGVCLTLVHATDLRISFDVVPETLAQTNLKLLKTADKVHLERSLRLGDPLDGHQVQGHVDATADLIARSEQNGEHRLTIRPPPPMMKFVTVKGAVALDGVSLTVAAVTQDTFDVALVPTTLRLTLLGHRPIGWPLNFEADILSKTVVNYLERRSPADK
jgi:riboflavin synthase